MTTSEVVTLVNDVLTADVAHLGAELRRLDDSSGTPLLWDGDPAHWTGRAPILFPIVGGLVGDAFRHAGGKYTLPRHGFARRSLFTLVDRDRAHATLRLEDDPATRTVWPFSFRLDVTHRLDGATLETVAEVTNRSDGPMPVAFGFHPAFRWPLPGAGQRADHVIRFEKSESSPVRRLDRSGLLSPTLHATSIRDRTLKLDDTLFHDDALIFDRLSSRRLTYGTDIASLEVAFEGMPHLGLWTKPGAGFLCIEPWQGHADPVGFDGPLTEKPGMLSLPPGGTRRFVMSVTSIDNRR